MLMELAIGLVLAGALIALVMPLLAMQRDYDAGRKDLLAIQQASAALLGQAVAGGGLPAPIRFAESVGADAAASHLSLDASLATLPLGFAGALPGQALGVPHISSLQTAFWYDAQPALRADALTAFRAAVSLDGTSFLSIVDQFDPDQNAQMSTGGFKSQLCRNLNSLQDIEQNIRARKSTFATDLLNVTLPRVWAAGNENRFTWNSATGYSDIAAPATTDSVFDNSAAAALVVVRRQPPALRRLDRQNVVYARVVDSGLDQILSARGLDAYPADLTPVGGYGFRVYENASTSGTDDPTADTGDYAGLVKAVSLGEFAQSLRNAGLCTTPAEACKANQLFVRFSNSVRSAPPPPSVSEGLVMRWSLVDNDVVPNLYKTDAVAHGAYSEGVCLDAFSADSATSAPLRSLQISFVSPAGSPGYVFRGGVLVDPGSTVEPGVTAGVVRWRPVTALSAAEAGKTVTISCTGTHSVSADGELLLGATVPSCSVNQLP